MIQLIKNEAGLRYENHLVITDLHIGLSSDYYRKGYAMPSQKKDILQRVKKIKGHCKNLIILGDIKHRIPIATNREEETIKELYTELRSIFKKVITIKGNHDGNIERVIKDTVKEYYVNDYAFIHGHTISDKALRSKKIIAGHTHPVYKYKNHLGINQYPKCYVISKKVVILPAFTNLSLGSNELIKPIKRHVKNEEKILLDFTRVQ